VRDSGPKAEARRRPSSPERRRARSPRTQGRRRGKGNPPDQQFAGELGAGSWEPGGAIETNAETQQNRRLALPCRALPCLVRDMAWLQTGPSRLILCCVQWSAANESGRATNAHDRTGVVLGAEQSALRGGGAAVVPMGPMAWASKNRRWWRPALP